MANKDMPCGLRPHGRILKAQEFVAGAAIYKGDPVKQGSDGQITASVTVPLIGVALNSAAAGGTVLVACDPSQEFIVQADSTDIDAQTDIFLNYDCLLGTPDTTYSISRAELDSDTGAITATLALKLLGIEARPDNALGTNVDCRVMINNHSFSAGTGAVGV